MRRDSDLRNELDRVKFEISSAAKTPKRNMYDLTRQLNHSTHFIPILTSGCISNSHPASLRTRDVPCRPKRIRTAKILSQSPSSGNKTPSAASHILHKTILGTDCSYQCPAPFAKTFLVQAGLITALSHLHKTILGTSHATTASRNPSFTATWRVGDVVVGRGYAGWTTSKSEYPCPRQNCSQGPPAEKTGNFC